MTRLEELHKLKEQEFKEKFEKEQIKRAVKDLDKEKIMVIKKEKEIEQERLAQEMNLVRRREKELKEELDKLDQNIKETQKIYEENDRASFNPQQRAQQISDQENMRRRMFEEKTERIANLKARQNNLMAEKNLIEKMQTDLRDGKMPDRETEAKFQERVNMNAQKHIEDIKGLQNFNTENFKNRMNNPTQTNQPNTFTFGDPQGSQPNNRPMSKQAMIGQSIVEDNYNPGYNPSLDVLNQRDIENNRLREENERLKNLLNGNDAPHYQHPHHASVSPTDDFIEAHVAPRNPPRQQRDYNPPPPMASAPLRQPTSIPRPQQPPPQIQPDYYQPPTSQQIAMPLRGGPKDFDDFLTSNFMQNQMKNVDLSEDERMLVHFTMMEADALRILNRIPQNTELYRFKLEQFKELSTQRAEAEKIVQETRLRKMKRALEMRAKEEDRRFDNQKFLDDVRKQDIATKLSKDGKLIKPEQVSVKEGLKDMNPKPNVSRMDGAGGRAPAEGEYNIDYGFVVHWDYVFGVPKNKKAVQLVFAIMNGEESILEPQLVEPRPTQDQNTQKNQCVIYENNHIREIEPHKLTNLLIEVQLPVSMNNVEDYVSHGWTFINLFDLNNQLNRGKFKLPLYKQPIFRNINADGVDQLSPVMDTTILFRISYPWKDEFSNLKNLEPHLNHRDYLIPSLHIKHASQPGVLASNLFGAPSQKQVKAKQALQQSFANQSEDDEPEEEVARLPPNIPSRRQPSREGGAPSTTTKPETPHDLIARSKGIRVNSDNIR